MCLILSPFLESNKNLQHVDLKRGLDRLGIHFLATLLTKQESPLDTLYLGCNEINEDLLEVRRNHFNIS